MKILVAFCFASSIIFGAFAQPSIKIRYDTASKSLNKRITEKMDIKSGMSYKVEVGGINTSFIGAKVVTKNYYLSSETPEILKPIFPGIAGSGDIGYLFPKSMEDTVRADRITILDYIFRKSKEEFTLLNLVKEASDELYSNVESGTLPIDDQREIAKDYIQNLCSEINEIQGGYDSLDLQEEEVTLQIDSIQARAELSVAYIKSVIGIYRGLLSDNVDIEKISDRTIAYYAELKEIDVRLKEENNYRKYVSFLRKSLNAQETVQNIKPFQAEKDFTEIDVAIINTYTSDTLNKSTFELYHSRKWSFDFSTGFFYNTITEPSYYLAENDSLTKVVKEEDNIDFDISIGALGHLTYLFTNRDRFGFSMGAALSPIDEKIRYLFGLSYLRGKRNQIAINFGAALAKVKKLSAVTQTESGSGDILVPASNSDIPTFETTDWGFYFGISYNLTSKKE